MSNSPMDSPSGLSVPGIAVRELRALHVTGWEMEAAGGYQLVCFDTDDGLKCLAIRAERMATLIDDLIVLLDRQIRSLAADGDGVFH